MNKKKWVTTEQKAFQDLNEKMVQLFGVSAIDVKMPLSALHLFAILSLEKALDFPIGSLERKGLMENSNYCVTQIINALPESEALYKELQKILGLK